MGRRGLRPHKTRRPPPPRFAQRSPAQGAPLSRAEALGTLLGGVGAAVMALGGSGGAGGGGRSGVGSASGAGAESSSGGIGGNGSGDGFGNGGFLGRGNDDDDAVSVQGDVAALLAAAAFVVYVWVGGRVRKSLPLHLYALSVTAAAGIMLAAAACLTPLIDPSHACPPHASTAHAAAAGTPLAWLSPPFLAPTLFLALGPGYMGHTGLNALLRYTTPLVIAIAITVEPPLGSLIGWAIGQSGAPDAATWVGGALMVGATLWVALEGERARGRQ
ncbi:unnamed protein product [Closterium sp. Naga37s-1]|nr:unnamed protein product [Closterium sp. Naga37s-1]